MAAQTTESPLAFLQLVAEPVRWELLQMLGRSDLRVGEMAARSGKAQNLVSYHLGALREAGLVSCRRSSADGRDTYYRLDVARVAGDLARTGASIHPALAPAETTGERPRRAPRPRVLFLCTGNSARSQMAEALIEHRSDGAFVARSAGSHPKPLHPNAVKVMRERGIDISAKRSKHLDRFADERFDLVVTMCDKVREVCPELPGAPEAVHWSMPDPSAGGGEEETYEAFVAAADDIEARVDLLIMQKPTILRRERSTT